MADRFTGRRLTGAARTLALASLAAAAACATTTPLPPGMAPAPGGSARAIPTDMPLTRAERTGYRETSTYEDVLAFLDTLQAHGAKMARGTIGRTSQGRDIPYVVASRPLVSTPAEAKALHRPIVYVQGNIHGGEVEGKEALLAMLRDLLLSPEPNVLDSLVLVAVPIYNADGNEACGPQERNRGVAERPGAHRPARQRAGARPQPRLREGRGAGDARLAGDVQRVGPRRLRRPAHHRRQLPRLRAHLLAVARPGRAAGRVHAADAAAAGCASA